jgi:hypothetical protein
MLDAFLLSFERPEGKVRNVARLSRFVIKELSMNKKDAAAYLGVATRTLESYVSKGSLTVQYVRGKTGDVADFNEGELRRLRAEADAKRAPRPAVVREASESSDAEPRSLARLSDVLPRALVQALFSGVNTGQKRESVPLGEKMLLSLPQAAEVSGVPVAYLRAAVKAKRLKTVAVGGGYGKVKRVDLETYVENL